MAARTILDQQFSRAPLWIVDASFLQAQLLQLLLGGVGKLLSLLTSCPAGMQMLDQNLSVVMGIIEALDPGSSQDPYVGDPRLTVRSANCSLPRSTLLSVEDQSYCSSCTSTPGVCCWQFTHC